MVEFYLLLTFPRFPLRKKIGACWFLKISKYIWDPARGGVLEWGGPGGGLPPPGTAAVSKHQTISGTQHEGACSRGGSGGGFRGGVPPPPARLLCPSIRLYLGPSMRGRARGGVPPPGTAAVSKHQIISGTQHEGACSRRGVRGGGYPPSARLLCPSIRQ